MAASLLQDHRFNGAENLATTLHRYVWHLRLSLDGLLAVVREFIEPAYSPGRCGRHTSARPGPWRS